METKVIIEGGHKRKAVSHDCLLCGKKFWARPRNRKYCSIGCARLSKRNRITLKCDLCGEVFERTPSKTKTSKSGLYFCSRHCKDQAQRIGGMSGIQPPHYGNGKSYRKKAFATLPHKCADCEYEQYDVLVVHHLDRDRENNGINNLIILCPTCHAVRHLKRRMGM